MPKARFFAPVLAVCLGAFLALPAQAQSPAPEDPVVATVDGAEIHLSEIARTQELLPDPYRGYPLQMIY